MKYLLLLCALVALAAALPSEEGDNTYEYVYKNEAQPVVAEETQSSEVTASGHWLKKMLKNTKVASKRVGAPFGRKILKKLEKNPKMRKAVFSKAGQNAIAKVVKLLLKYKGAKKTLIKKCKAILKMKPKQLAKWANASLMEGEELVQTKSKTKFFWIFFLIKKAVAVVVKKVIAAKSKLGKLVKKGKKWAKKKLKQCIKKCVTAEESLYQYARGGPAYYDYVQTSTLWGRRRRRRRTSKKAKKNKCASACKRQFLPSSRRRRSLSRRRRTRRRRSIFRRRRWRRRRHAHYRRRRWRRRRHAHSRRRRWRRRRHAHYRRRRWRRRRHAHYRRRRWRRRRH